MIGYKDAQDMPTIGVCHRCRCDISDNIYMYYGYALCRDCWLETKTDETKLDYAAAYPDSFKEFLGEEVISGNLAVKRLLRDYAEWNTKDAERFIDWVVR